jgi:hypothetical protein
MPTPPPSPEAPWRRWDHPQHNLLHRPRRPRDTPAITLPRGRRETSGEPLGEPCHRPSRKSQRLFDQPRHDVSAGASKPPRPTPPPPPHRSLRRLALPSPEVSTDPPQAPRQPLSGSSIGRRRRAGTRRADIQMSPRGTPMDVSGMGLHDEVKGLSSQAGSRRRRLVVADLQRLPPWAPVAATPTRRFSPSRARGRAQRRQGRIRHAVEGACSCCSAVG